MPETQLAVSKAWYKSKTVNTNAVAAFGALMYGLQSGDWATAAPTVGMAVVNIVLRAISNSPLE